MEVKANMDNSSNNSVFANYFVALTYRVFQRRFGYFKLVWSPGTTIGSQIRQKVLQNQEQLRFAFQLVKVEEEGFQVLTAGAKRRWSSSSRVCLEAKIPGTSQDDDKELLMRRGTPEWLCKQDQSNSIIGWVAFFLLSTANFLSSLKPPKQTSTIPASLFYHRKVSCNGHKAFKSRGRTRALKLLYLHKTIETTEDPQDQDIQLVIRSVTLFQSQCWKITQNVLFCNIASNATFAIFGMKISKLVVKKLP